MANKQHGEQNPNVIPWRCMKCNRLLGNLMIDDETGEEAMHIKEKDTVIVFKAGGDGWLRRICPGCGGSQRIESKSSEQGFEN